MVTSFEWFQQPEQCAAAAAFISAIASQNPYGNVVLLEASNEPEVAGGNGAPVSATFLCTCLIPALRVVSHGINITVAMGAYTSWGGEYASVLPLVDIVDWHCYNGAGNGAAVAAEIASMQAIAGVKPLLLTEVIARPSQPLAAALPVARAAGVGVFIWALIFTPGNWWSVPYLPGGPPFQGFLFPNGTAYDEVEEVALLQRRSGSVVYRAANFDANAPFIFGGGWTPMAAGCSAASCEYQSSKGPREGAAQSTTDSGANVTITLPANTAAFAL